MSSVDERIVEMRFDNKQFESGVQKSIKDLDSLKRGLDLDASARSLSNLEMAGRSFSLAGIAQGVEALANRFSTLGIIGMTALQNITNAAINAGSRFASALTIDPIKMGFNEYETKMGAIQTILTNTQKTTKTVAKSSAASIKQSSESALNAASEANAAALKNLQKKQDLELKEYQKTADKALDILTDKYEKESDILEKAQAQELKSYQKLIDDEMNILDDKYEKESEALSKAIEKETTLFKEAHQEKLDLYNEEYMSKLKSVDEDRYNKIKAIDDEIESIKGLTKSEDEARKKTEQQNKLLALEERINNAATKQDKLDAENELSEYKDKITREQLIKDREAIIDSLNLSKQSVIEESNARKEELKKEYEDKVRLENERYNDQLTIIREEQTERTKALKKTYLQEKELIQERRDVEKQTLRDQQAEKSKALKDAYLQERELIGERQREQKDAIKERYDAEIDAINKVHKASMASLKAQQAAGTGATETVQTKGSTLEDVNKALKELNDYSDKTIYNFAEMAKNVGTFTAAGIDLETSVESIKGIANLAAGSGSSSIQASTAMYQLSQALAAGSLKLQDWNSVVNAGMGGQLFQNALKTTAKEMGIVVNEAIPFRESLESGWITAEVLTKTLSKFAKDESLIKAATQVKTFTQLFDTMKESVQSGWAQSWEAIIGDRDQASQMLTNINDAFGKLMSSSAEARNTMLEFWNANGGRAAIIQSLSNAFNGLGSILKPIVEAFREIFPPMTGARLVEISKAIMELTSNFKIGAETSDNLKRTFKGLFALLDIGKQAIAAVAKGLGALVGYLLPAGDGFLSITANIGDFLVALDNAIKSSNAFNVAIEAIGNFLKPIADGIRTAINIIIDAFKAMANIDTSGLDSFSDRVKMRFEPFTKLGDFIANIFSRIAGVLKDVAPLIYKFADMIGNAFKKLQTNIVGALDNAEFNSIFDIINGGLFAAILLGLKKFITSLTAITDSAGGFLGNITDILNGVKGCLQAYQNDIQANTLLKIAIAIGILSASLMVLSLIDSDKLTSSLAAMSVMFVELFGSMGIFQKIMGSPGFKGIGGLVTALIGVSVAILILSSAMTKLAKLDWNGITKGLVSVAALMGMLVATAKMLSSDTPSMTKGALGFILFAAAINILAEAVKKLGDLDLAALTKGLVGVGVLMTEMALFMKVTDLSGMGVLKGVGILLLATSLVILADAVKKFGELDIAAMIKGLTAVGVVLTEIAIFVNLTGDAKHVITTAIGLTILGAAMLIFAQAVGAMGDMSWEQIGKGLLAMAVTLAEVGIAMRLMPNNMILTGVGLVVVASALLTLSKALSEMGGMTWEEIAKGLVTLAGSLTIIAVAMMFMTTALPGAAALLVVAGALAILAPVLKTLGSMSLSEIGKGLLALVGVFVVLGAAGLLLGPLVPVLIGLGAAMALLGIGALAVGAGLMLFSAGLAALAVSGAAGAAALVVIVTSITGLIPFILKTLAQGIIDFAKVIAAGAPAMTEAIIAVSLAVIAALVVVTPTIVTAVMTLLLTLLRTLVTYIPQITDAGMKMIFGFLQGIANNIQSVVEMAVQIMINFLSGIASMTPSIIQAGFNLIISFINGLAESIRTNTPRLIDAITNLMSAVIEAALQVLVFSTTGFLDVGAKVMSSGFIQGIKNRIGELTSTLHDMIKQCVRVLSDKGKDFYDMGVHMLDGFIEGFRSMIKKVVKEVMNMASTAVNVAKDVLGIHSPSREFAEIGMYAAEGFAGGLKDFSGSVESASKDVGNNAMSALRSTISNISDVVSNNMDTTPIVRPVIDLSNVEAGSQQLNKMFSQNRSINMSSVSKKLPKIEQTATSSNQNTQENSRQGGDPSFSFVQNNYSPKALSRLDIYRQTRNQFSTLKGLVGV